MDMDIQDIMPLILLALIVMAIIIFIPRDAVSQVAGNLTGPFLIVPTGVEVPNNIGTAKPVEIGGKLAGYDITLETKIAYINPEAIKDGMLESGNIKVVPVISFKGGQAKAKIKLDDGSTRDYFTINRDEMIKGEKKNNDWRFDFHVTTSEAPIKKYDSGDPRIKASEDTVDGVVKENDAFILRSADKLGVFLVMLDEYQQKIDFVNKDRNLIPSYKCEAVFMIRCMNETMSLRVQEATDCIGDICSDSRDICNGKVEVEIEGKPDCEKKENKMRIEVKGGVEREFEEEVSISFWRKSDCVDSETDFRRLTIYCESEKLSGLYTYGTPLISTAPVVA